MSQAAERGFPVSIYRSSAVSGNMHSSAPEPDQDFIRLMVRTMVANRSTPKIGTQAPEFAVDFIPIDFLTSNLLRLSTSTSLPTDPSNGKPSIFHIGNTNPLPLSKLSGLMGKIRQDGRKGRALPLDSWLDIVSKDEDPDAQMRFAVLKDYFTAGHNMFALERTKTAEAGEAAGGDVAECPPASRVEYLKWLFSGV